MGVAEELGLGLETVRRWCLAARKEEKPPRALVPVRVVSRPSVDASKHRLSLSGWRVDGLTLAEAIELLRALG